MRTVEQLLSRENLEAYVKACETLTEDYCLEQNEVIIVPSRGANVPAILLMYGMNILEIATKSEWYVLPFLEEYFPENSHSILFLPFTADVSLERHEEIIDAMRKYWVRVTSAFYCPPEKRIHIPEFAEFLFLLKEIESRENVAEYYQNFPKVSKAGIIDTAISGRAIATILKNFQQELQHEKLPIPYILIDRHGEKLKPRYTEIIGRYPKPVFSYFLPSLVTEDKGAALQGVTAVIYVFPEYRDEELTLHCIGSWHEASGSYKEAFNMFLDLLKMILYEKSERNYKSRFEHLKEKLISLIKSHALLKPQGRFLPSIPERYEIAETRESRAHVLHVIFKESATKRFKRDFNAYLSNMGLCAEKYFSHLSQYWF